MCLLCWCELLNPEIEEESRWWLTMHWCLFGARTSATIMMTFAGQCISQIWGIIVKRRTASKKETDGLLVGFANIEFDVTIKNMMLGNPTIFSVKYLWSCCILHSCQVLGGKCLIWFGLLRVMPYKMASLATVYFGRANSIVILFVLIAACESGSPLDMAA